MAGELTTWDRADRAAARMNESMIDFAVEVKALNDAGTTQAAIGERYNLSQSSVKQFVRIAGDPRISDNITNLPKSPRSLYLLTTLGDDDFEKMAKPDTTQADILKLKADLAEAKRLADGFRAESNERRIRIRELEAKGTVVETVTDNRAAEERYRAEIARLKEQQRLDHERHLKAVEDVRNRVKGSMEKDAERIQESIIVRQRTLDELNAKVAGFQKLTDDTVLQKEKIKAVEQHLVAVVADSYPLTDTDYNLSADDARSWLKLINQHIQWLGGLKMTAEQRLAAREDIKLISD